MTNLFFSNIIRHKTHFYISNAPGQNIYFPIIEFIVKYKKTENIIFGREH